MVQAELEQQRTSWRVGTVLTAAMAVSMVPLFLLGAFGPSLVAEFGISRSLLGALASAGFAVAALLSFPTGRVVAALGPRRCLIALFVVSALALGGFAIARSYGLLIAVVAVSGVPQALANPVTNQLIVAVVPVRRRALLTGIKQSGVQLGAFAAGLPLAAVAAATNWRVAVGVVAAAALLAAVGTFGLPADPLSPRRPVLVGVPLPSALIARLAVFSVLLGAGVSAVNTYVALFADQQLRLPGGAASALVAVLGVAGIAGRVGWSRVAVRGSGPAEALAPLTGAAVLAAVALLVSPWLGAAWAWLGVLGVGGFAVSANAVSMVTVISSSPKERVGPDSAIVAAGFFAGFAVGPPLFGVLVDAAGGDYAVGWALVAAEFLVAAGLAWLVRRGRPA